MSWQRHRARIGALSRSRPADDPELLTERRLLRVQRLAEHVTNVLAEKPALTDEDRRTIAALLIGGGE